MTVEGCTLTQLIDRAQERVGLALPPGTAESVLVSYLQRRRGTLFQKLTGHWPDTTADAVTIALVLGQSVYAFPESLGVRFLTALPAVMGDPVRVAIVHPEDVDAEVGLRVTLRATELTLVRFPQDWYTPGSPGPSLTYTSLTAQVTQATAAPALDEELAPDPKTARLVCQWLELDAAIWLGRKYQRMALVPALALERDNVWQAMVALYEQSGHRMNDRYRRAYA